MKHAAFSAKAFLAALSVFIILSASHSKAADYYWVNGSGVWSDNAGHWATTSGGVIFHTTIPTLYDDVYFDGNSFSADSQYVYLDSTFAYCKNMDWTGVNYKVKFYTGLWSMTDINIYGSLTLDADIYDFLCSLNFLGTASNLTLNTAGVYVTGKYAFNGTGTYFLNSDLNCFRIFFNNGIFYSNNYSINTYGIYTSAYTPVELHLGSSNIYCVTMSLNSNTIINASACNLYISQLTGYFSQLSSPINVTFKNIYFTGTQGEIQGPVSADTIWFSGTGAIRGYQMISATVNCDYLYFASGGLVQVSSNLTSEVQYAEFLGDIGFGGEITFDTLFFNNTGSEISLSTITINDTIIFNGSCTTLTQIHSGHIIKSTGTVEFDYVQLQGVFVSGGAAFIANNSIDLGNNNGWQINAPASRDLFWVNGQGAWSDSNHWALTSGGTGGNCAPNPTDNIFFDAQSFTSSSDSVFFDYPTIFCKNLNIQGLTGVPVFINPLGWPNNYVFTVSGSLTILSDVILVCNILFDSNLPGNTINSTSYLPGLTFEGDGNWSLTSNINSSSVNFQRGSFNSNNYDMVVDNISDAGNSSSIINLGTSTINCYNFDLSDIGANLISQNTNVVFDSSWATCYFYAENQSFNNIYFHNTASINGEFSCNELYFEKENTIISTDAVIQKLVLNTNSNLIGNFTIDSLVQNTLGTKIEFGPGSLLNIGSSFEIAAGICDETTIIRSDSSVTFNKLSGSVDLDFVLLENIQATGGATFSATNCIDVGGNTGWNIVSPASRDLYWIGGAGNWSDQNHWALSSGGAGGNCIPTLYDNIYFDDNSFSPSGVEMIWFDIPQIYLKDFNFNTTYNSPWILKRFAASSDCSIMVNGSINFNAKTYLFGASNVIKINMTLVSADSGNVILSSETDFSEVNMNFQGQGVYTLADSLSCNMLIIEQGSFIASGNSINCQKFKVTSPQSIVDFGINTLYCDSIDVAVAGTGFQSQDLNVVLNYISGSNPTNLFKSNNQSFKSIKGGAMFSKFVGGFSFESMEIPGNASISSSGGSSIIQVNKMVVMNDLDVYNYNHYFIIDSLLLNNAGHTITFSSGDTLSVISGMITNATASFPVELKCDLPGNFVIESSTGMLCLDNMIMQGVHVIGGGVFYAGANTVDLGNNQGWTYASCNPANSDVWPGDANYDLVVNNFDVLNVGLGYNATGPIRPGASNNWVAQPSADWPWQFANGANLKNADCNGDSTINNNDTTAISLNYGLTHPARFSNPGTASMPGPPLYLVATPDTVMEGDTVQIDIFLGTNQIPVDSIYGLAFTLSFDSTLIDTTYMPFDYTVGWMGVPNVDLLTFEKKFLSQGIVDVAITRTDYMNMGGSGIIVSTGVVIIDNIGARLSSAPPYVPLPITISNVRAVTASEYYFSLSLAGDQVEIDTLGTTGLPDVLLNQGSIRVFPNPADDKVYVISERETIVKMELFDKMGVALHTSYPNSRTSFINISSLSSGIYTLESTTKTGKSVKKVVISHP